VLGGKELEELARQKKVLLAESSLNRATWQAEVEYLRSAAGWVGEAGRVSRHFKPLLLFLAPLAGFLLSRRSRQSSTWLNRMTAAAKWVGPLLGLWKRFSAGRRQSQGGEASERAE
jgi:hypothetical protein